MWLAAVQGAGSTGWFCFLDDVRSHHAYQSKSSVIWTSLSQHSHELLLLLPLPSSFIPSYTNAFECFTVRSKMAKSSRLLNEWLAPAITLLLKNPMKEVVFFIARYRTFSQKLHKWASPPHAAGLGSSFPPLASSLRNISDLTHGFTYMSATI